MLAISIITNHVQEIGNTCTYGEDRRNFSGKAASIEQKHHQVRGYIEQKSHEGYHIRTIDKISE
jgi:hypothetical protein